MNAPFAARSAYAAEPITRAAMAPTATAAVVSAAAALAAAPLTPTVAAPSGGTAAGRASLAVPLARIVRLFLSLPLLCAPPAFSPRPLR